MVLLITNLEKQEQAASAGYVKYPEVKSLTKGMKYMDEFLRTTLNNTDTPLLYTVTLNGAGGSGVIRSARDAVLLTTDILTGNDVGIITSGMVFKRSAIVPDLDGRSQMSLDILFSIGTATSNEAFVGWYNAASAVLSTLPTTQAHMGIYIDQSVSNNWILSSSNATTQVTTDTGVAVSDSVFLRLKITWDGLNSATIRLYTTTDLVTQTLQATHTVTALGSVEEYVLQLFEQTETTAARTMTCYYWKVDID